MPTIEELHQQHSMEIVQGHIKRIVETYDLEWRVVHELVQNAIDAIQANSKVAEGQVDLVLDIDNDEVTVTDNGTGFTHDTKLLCPNGTGMEKRLSSRSPSKGYQGVGLKAVMYSTARFEIESETSDLHWTFLAENLASYIDPDENNVPEYQIKTDASKDEKTYTIVKARFPSKTLHVFLSRLNRFLNENSVTWKDLYFKEREDRNADPTDKYLEHFFSWYFRTQSYIGCANRLLNIPVKNASTGEFEAVKPVSIRLHLKSERQFIELDGPIGDWLRDLGKKEFTTTIPNRAWDYSEIATANLNQAAKYRITPQVVTMKPNDSNWDTLKVAFRDRFLDLKLTPNYEETDFRDRYDDFIVLLERPHSSVKAENFQDVLEKVTGIHLAIGRTSYFEKLGLTNHGIRVIASNGTLTDHTLSEASTSSTWYQQTIHMIINVDANLNVGKRHLSNNPLVGRINDFYKACYPVLVNISKLFVERGPDSPGEDSLPDVVGLKKLRREQIPFRRFPNDESTLIGLFSTAFSRLYENYSIYGYFGKARYDGKFSWITNEPGSDNDLLTVEFKVMLEKLVEEFDLAVHNKEFRDVDLIVVWDRTLSHIDWHVKGIPQERQNILEMQGVPTNIVKHVLEDRYGNFRPLICVADLLLNFNTTNGEIDDLNAFVEELN